MMPAHIVVMGSAGTVGAAPQTVTRVRPMLAPIGTPRTPEGKCLFLMHFGESVGL